MDDELGQILLTGDPVPSAEEYVARGGGRGLAAARALAPEEVIELVRRSGLRGRGGAGFPTGIKWRTVREDPCPTKYVVCNAAEGEPGTFKDRWLLRANPYSVVEGLGIAAYAVGAERAFIGIKAGFGPEVARLTAAMEEMAERDLVGPVPVELIQGPDEYLFGEEKALLEVIEGNDPLPRIVPPWMEGLFRRPGSPEPDRGEQRRDPGERPADPRPRTGVVPLVRHGGLARHDAVHPVRRRPLSGRLRAAARVLAPGSRRRGGRRRARGSPSEGGVPGRVEHDHRAGAARYAARIRPDACRGHWLGSGGFVVYDDSACIVRATLAFSRFLYVESCAQCPACKHGTGAITDCSSGSTGARGPDADVETILARALTVTDAQRCALPTGETLIAQSAIQVFGSEFAEHFGRAVPSAAGPAGTEDRRLRRAWPATSASTSGTTSSSRTGPTRTRRARSRSCRYW